MADTVTMEKSWLDYSGQTTAELLACKKTHRIDSLNCAFEWGIQAKVAQKKKLSPEERLVLAIRALDREVNNGGFDQFLTNSSRRYAGEVVEALNKIGARKTATLAAEALKLSKLPFEERLDALDPFDEKFYTLCEIELKLFRFIEKNQAAIQLPKARERDIPKPLHLN